MIKFENIVENQGTDDLRTTASIAFTSYLKYPFCTIGKIIMFSERGLIFGVF